MKKLKVIDLFAGAGGLSNGFEQTKSFKVVCAVELNKEALDTYKENHKENDNIIYRQDITTFFPSKEKELKNIPPSEIVVIGGPPCQGFSNANRQKNYLLSGNNKLVREYVRVIREIKPAGFLMENVKAMKSDKHKFFVTKSGIDTNSEFLEKYGVRTVKEHIILANFGDLETIGLQFINDFPKVSYWPEPIFKLDEMLSKIRMIERAIRYKRNISFTKQSDSVLLNKMAIALGEFEDKYKITFKKTINLLLTLADKKNVFLDDVNEINALIKLNRLLLHCKELKTEDINYKIIVQKNMGSGMEIKAEVFSFDVVDYLLNIFKKELGYTVDDRVLTASDYGVPQERKRYMIIGVNNEVSNILKIDFPKRLERIKNSLTVYDAIYSLKNYTPSKNVFRDESFTIPLKERLKSESKLEKYYTVGFTKFNVSNHVTTESREISKNRFAHLQEGQNFHNLTEDLKSNYTDISRTQNTVYLRLKYSEPSRTVVNVRKSMWIHPEIDRALSIREAARLQSFPDYFIFKGRKDSQYQQIGNAVPPLMARAVAESMLKMLNREPERKIAEDLFDR
ncbi:DNA cytosine methyltransferase [Fictibacillus sp. 5RED26]|uniref:DNA cytosine methyltransferase n=1 Tax=Fictibacillus sp. 5RED26 TaxID=2745876 RepID=UPI0018CD1040|nr:DNA cytosine methyltransferase [Fictibacillus sp. 5RED26]MBH0157307.1 DNA cytosine methyltransferase [Fictibacillus sp. 5RED26]